jgi:hypothetical protein
MVFFKVVTSPSSCLIAVTAASSWASAWAKSFSRFS